MADSHLQVNPDGTTVNRKTVLWPSSKPEQQEIIKDIFTRNGWTVPSIVHQGGSFWKVQAVSDIKSLNINLYISSIRDESRQPDEFKMQLGTTYPEGEESGWVTIILGIYVIDDGNDRQYVLSGYDRSGYNFSTNPSIRGTRTKGLQKAYLNGMYKSERSILFKPDLIYFYIDNLNELFGKSDSFETYSFDSSISDADKELITALRTKPFLLLAGISGTGKSQKVQELAFMSCPEELRDSSSTTPGNYKLVEVKPNWHDSTELLGYYSALSGKYELTDFIRFTYKAIKNKEYPFFLCLDEMNLAPVEQYFAEFLSVLETRKKVDGEIRTEPLLGKEKFSNCQLTTQNLINKPGYVTEEDEYQEVDLYSEEDKEIICFLKENGLHLPENLFVIGTVNMDDTTHQFSRKVIDRAFTIEMNGGRMAEMFLPKSKKLLQYREDYVKLNSFKSEFVRAYEVLEDSRFAKYSGKISSMVPELLGDPNGKVNEASINGILNSTPFRVSYRVQNELVLYLSVLIENADFPEEIDSLIIEATLAILLEKILPRVQGEQKQLETKGGQSNILKDLRSFIEEKFTPEVSEGESLSDDTLYSKVLNKLDEMDDKLSSYYTNFF